MHAGPLPADCAGPNGRISLLPRGSCVVANNVVDGSRGNNLELLNPSPDLLDNTFIGAGSVGLLVLLQIKSVMVLIACRLVQGLTVGVLTVLRGLYIK